MRSLLGPGTVPVELFLTEWYGPPDRPYGELPAGAHEMPLPLRDWYRVTSRWSEPVVFQNEVLLPEQTWVDDGKRVFWVENQGVWVWGYDMAGSDDPAVFDRENEDDEAWLPTGVALSEFLLHLTVFEAIWGAPHGASAAWATGPQLAAILAPLWALAAPAWRWPMGGSRLYAGDELLAVAGPNIGYGEPLETAERFSVFLAARRPGNLAYLHTIDGLDWDVSPH